MNHENIFDNIMPDEKKKIAIGVDDYKELISNDHYYIDKTLMLRDIINDGSKVMLFTRPRRFGKTLNMSMIYHYFNKSEEDLSYLFRDKKIWNAGDKFTKEQGKYPVILLTMKDWKPTNWKDGYSRIVSDIARLFTRHDYLLNSVKLSKSEKNDFESICNKKADNAGIDEGLKFLSSLLHKHHDKQVIILVDEYDTLLNQAFSRGFYDEAVAFLRNFLGSCMKNNEALHKGILTGIFKVAKESIFSDMNNFNSYSIISNQFSYAFGFTEDEANAMLTYYGLSHNAENAAKWYNGYTFGKTNFTTVYNPWSLLMYSYNKILEPYWINTSGNQIIKDIILRADSYLTNNIEDLMNGKTLSKKPINQFLVYDDIKRSGDAIWSFLIMSGYLKFSHIDVEGLDTAYCDVEIPNQEMHSFFRLIYKNWLAETLPQSSPDRLIKALLNKEVEEFYTIFQEIFLRTVSFHDTANPNAESFYHAFTLGLLVNIDNEYIVKSNREAGFGRFDVMLIPKDNKKTGIIIEFKTASKFKNESLKDAVKSAMQQIEDKRYDEELKSFGITDILKLAIAFSGKEILLESK